MYEYYLLIQDPYRGGNQMNWLGAFRLCGGHLTPSQIQIVKNALDEMGYETDSEDVDWGWITRLRRGTTTLWRVESGRGDYGQQQSVIQALDDEHIYELDRRFGSYEMDDPDEDEEDDPEDIPIAAKPFVGAATRLPLPKERK